MKQKFIFDVDGTIFDVDYATTDLYFETVLSSRESQIFIPQIYSLICQYERKFKKYELSQLSDFFSKTSSISITPDMLLGWFDAKKNMNTKIKEDTIEILEYLKSKDYELVVLSNQITMIQRERLKNNGLLDYFSEIHGGDFCLKPYKESYLAACGNTPRLSCIMIGDHLEKDYLSPRKLGIHSILFDPKNKSKNRGAKDKIKKLSMIKEFY